MAWPQPSAPTSNRFLPMRQHRLDRGDRRGVTADHDGERAVLGARHAAGYRRIDQRDIALRELACRACGCRPGRPSSCRSRPRPGFRLAASAPPCVSSKRVAHLAAGRQHGDHDLGVGGELGEACRSRAPRALRKVLRPLRGDVVAHHVVAAAHEIGRHRRAHVAEADEADAFRTSLMALCSPCGAGSCRVSRV